MHVFGTNKSGKGGTKIRKTKGGSRCINTVLRETMVSKNQVYKNNFVSKCQHFLSVIMCNVILEMNSMQ